MIVYRRTSLFDSSAQTLVNTVNCVGVMGKGVAKEFKTRHPEMFTRYKKICDAKLLSPGKLWLWQGSTQWVLNFPTKLHWRSPSKLEWVEDGLKKFAQEYDRRGIESISFPRLGCGNGGLDWDVVRPLMEEHLGDLDIPVFIHDYEKDIGLPEHIQSISDRLALKSPDYSGFDEFYMLLNLCVTESGGTIPNISGDGIITFLFDKCDNLIVDEGDRSFLFEQEDLKSIWYSIKNGLLTKKQVGYLNRGAGDAVLTLISALPGTRPIEIQPFGENTEIAVEFLGPDKKLMDPEMPSQAAFSWA